MPILIFTIGGRFLLVTHLLMACGNGKSIMLSFIKGDTMGTEDRREFRRYNCQSACEIKINSHTYKGFVVDYSEGLGIIAENGPLLKEGACADIILLQSTTTMKGEVAWVRDVGRDVRVGFKRVGNLEGHLKAFKLADVFIGIQRGTKTGTLKIKSGAVVKRVYINNGDIVFADSSLKNDGLGEMLVIEGIITQQQFDEATARLIETDEKLGKVLVEMSCLTPRELYQAVRRQVEGIILGLFAIDDGTFEFNEGSLPTEEVITLIISAADIIYRGMKRVRSVAYVEQMCPSPAAVLDLSHNPMDIFQLITLENVDKEILYLINGNSPLETILSLSPSTRFETLKTISAFLRIGIVTIKEDGDESTKVSARDILSCELEEGPNDFLTGVEELHLKCNVADYYDYLDISRDASTEEMQAAYLSISKKFHPDRHFAFSAHDIKGKLIDIFAYATEAHAILSDEERRVRYDESLDVMTPGPPSSNALLKASNESGDTETEAALQSPSKNEDEDTENTPVKNGALSDTHYELGVAYKEMGLVEEAINEFRVAAEDMSIRICCCKEIAACYIDAGNQEYAIIELMTLISEIKDDTKLYMDVKYSLADIYVQSKEYYNALNMYNELLQEEGTYRDVSEKTRLLTELLSSGKI